MFPSVEDLLDYVAKNAVKFIDWRFTDLCGRWHHLTHSTASLGTAIFSSGVCFDGSSIPGWQPIERSGLLLIPDVGTAFLDPFSAQPSMVVICDVVDPHEGVGYSHDPRNTAKKAQQYILSTSVADDCYFGPEIEFFVFDRARFGVDAYSSYFRLTSQESGSGTMLRGFPGDLGYQVRAQGGYLKVSPVDSLHDLRSEVLSMLSEVGVIPLLHHHEVASSQCEIGFHHSGLVASADNVQKCKYVIRNVASSYGKTVTFMPKPVKNDNGSGMHCHQSLWKDGTNVFVGNGRTLSDTCLHYIGGIIKHGKALSAFANPSTNSYRRLVPNFEAPTWLAYSYDNRSAAIRVPYAPSGDAASRRIEVRFPDPLANPYLCFASQLMAGMDGIRNKVDPVEVMDKSLYTLSECETEGLTSVATSLEEALATLGNDREFLLEGGVFTNDQISSYIQLKKLEVEELRACPHPAEFVSYYSL